MNKVVGIVKVRDGIWHISYDHHCGCGCTKKRYTFTTNQNAKPGKNKAQQLADEDFNKR